MSKITSRSSTQTAQYSSEQSDDADLATLRAFVAELKNNPKQLRAIAIKAGIVTRLGNLTKAYR
jgi:hypothetical protein